MDRTLPDFNGLEDELATPVNSDSDEATWSNGDTPSPSSSLPGGAEFAGPATAAGGTADGGATPHAAVVLELPSQVDDPDDSTGEDEDISTMPLAIDAVNDAATSISGTFKPIRCASSARRCARATSDSSDGSSSTSFRYCSSSTHVIVVVVAPIGG